MIRQGITAVMSDRAIPLGEYETMAQTKTPRKKSLGQILRKRGFDLAEYRKRYRWLGGTYQ